MDTKIKSVAILLPCLLTGGTEVATYETALAFKSQSMQVDVVVYFDEIDPVMLHTFQAANLRVIALKQTRAQGIYGQLALLWSLFVVLLQGRYPLIWVQYMTPTLLPLLIARLLTRHLVAAVHVAASHFQPTAMKRLCWLARYWLTRVVCVSHTTAQGIFGNDNLRGRVVVIPNTLDLSVVRAAPCRDWCTDLGWPKQSLIIGFTGRLVTIKGGHILLQAVGLAAQGLPLLRVVIVGDGDERIPLQNLTAQLGLKDVVHFTGRLPREAVYSAIKGFDIAAMPSLGGLEGFGLSALEAMAAGVPVVASKVDALAEVIIDGETGVLFEMGNAAALAEAIVNLSSNAELRLQMGRAAVQHVATHYDISAYRQQMVDFVNGMVC